MVRYVKGNCGEITDLIDKFICLEYISFMEKYLCICVFVSICILRRNVSDRCEILAARISIS